MSVAPPNLAVEQTAGSRALAAAATAALAVTPHAPRTRIREPRTSAALLKGGTQMKRSAVAVCCVLFLVSMEASAQSGRKCAGPQLGTWKLQSFTTEDLASGQKTDLFGAQPSGYISYGADCRMYAILIKDGRKAPAMLVPTDAERVELYSGVIAYAGIYSIDGDKPSY
jgi:hypothetical protein